MYDHEPAAFRPLCAHGQPKDWLEFLGWLEEEGLVDQWLGPGQGLHVLSRDERRGLSGWEEDELGPLALIPMVVEDRLVGALAFEFSEEASLSPERRALLVSLAGQVALILRNAELYRGSQELAVIEERRRIAREIHDGVAQNMAHLMLKAELIQKLVHRDPERAVEESRVLRVGIEESVQELRRCIHSLRPVHLAEFGLVTALRRVAEDLAEHDELELDLKLPAEMRFGSGTEAAVFRIVQEALNNVRKHAKATRVDIELREEGGLLLASVRDDGLGFDSRLIQGEGTGHFGLAQMKERAREVGGELTVRSSPGQGTLVEVAIPCGRRLARQLAARGDHQE